MSMLQLRVFDGTRQLASTPSEFLVTILNGNQQQLVRGYFSNEHQFDLPSYGDPRDKYSVVVSADGYRQTGFYPVTLSAEFQTNLDVMLIANDPGFSFVDARWEDANGGYQFLGSDVDNATGAERYDDLLDKESKSLACLLNLSEAMSSMFLPQHTPLEYIKQVRWDAPYAPAPDRFFAWCDPQLITQVKIAAKAGKFAMEVNPGVFHRGATASWKQIQFGEANVQLTFHEGEKKTIGGIECVMVEPDIDYYKDLGAHALYEVIPNELTHSLTDPIEVYVLRWTAGRSAGIPEFAPMYTITS